MNILSKESKDQLVNDILNKSNNELIELIYAHKGHPIADVSKAVLEARLFEKLNKTISEANRSSEKLSTKLNVFTVWLIILTAVLVVFSLLQILQSNRIWPFCQ